MKKRLKKIMSTLCAFTICAGVAFGSNLTVSDAATFSSKLKSPTKIVLNVKKSVNNLKYEYNKMKSNYKKMVNFPNTLRSK